jgi:hypothetical protein
MLEYKHGAATMTDYRVDRSTVLPLLDERGRDAASLRHTLRAGAWL